jgi:hypothetical protein
MYICSFLLFISASTILCIGFKNCRNSVYNRKKYEDVRSVLRKNDNYDFYEHHCLLQDVNMEIKQL